MKCEFCGYESPILSYIGQGIITYCSDEECKKKAYDKAGYSERYKELMKDKEEG